MPAKDIYHQIVIAALEKEGWVITHDPLHIKYGAINLYIDLGAENLIAAEKNGQKIAVEIKSFAQLSLLHEFYTTVGQFISYRLVLKAKQPERQLYLAIPQEAQNFFILPFTQAIIQENNLKYFIYNIDKQEISQWIK